VFGKFGKIVKEEFMWHKDGPRRGQPRGYCFVEFATHEV
jgi:RNA recognition motif-containing protein